MKKFLVRVTHGTNVTTTSVLARSHEEAEREALHASKILYGAAEAIVVTPVLRRTRVRAAEQHVPGQRVFYVRSESDPSKEYAVVYARRGGQRRFFCSCPDFLFRRVASKKLCKHAREVAERLGRGNWKEA